MTDSKEAVDVKPERDPILGAIEKLRECKAKLSKAKAEREACWEAYEAARTEEAKCAEHATECRRELQKLMEAD